MFPTALVPGCQNPDSGGAAQGQPHLPVTGSVCLGILSAVTCLLLFCLVTGSSFGGERLVSSPFAAQRLLQLGSWPPTVAFKRYRSAKNEQELANVS